MKSAKNNRAKELYFQIICFVLFVFFVAVSQAAPQPHWCSIGYFKLSENKTNAPNTKRLHEFTIGGLTLGGMAIGGSDATEVAGFSRAPASMKYCTWYYNEGNKGAEKAFHWKYLTGPYWAWLPWTSSNEIADKYETVLNQELPMMLSCAEQFGYIAGGCDGQKHRGPSVFAWFLAVTGCEPETATKIANHFWALNGVPHHTRVKIAERGFQIGNKFPEYRRRFQKVMNQ